MRFRTFLKPLAAWAQGLVHLLEPLVAASVDLVVLEPASRADYIKKSGFLPELHPY